MAEHDRNLFFIVYKARSGSTFLSDVLNRHPALAVTFESNLVPRLLHWQRGRGDAKVGAHEVDAVLEVLYGEQKFVDWELPRPWLAEQLRARAPFDIPSLVRLVIDEAGARSKGDAGRAGIRACGLKKNGWYIQRIGLLQQLFPDAKFIHLVRDGRAVYASARVAVHSEKERPFEGHPLGSAAQWVRLLEAAELAARTANVLEVSYEALVRQPTLELPKILGYLGVSADAAMLDAMTRPSDKVAIPESQRHLHTNVGKGPQASRIDAWKQSLSPRDIQLYELVAGDMLVRKGYELVYPQRVVGRAWSQLTRLEAKLRARAWT